MLVINAIYTIDALDSNASLKNALQHRPFLFLNMNVPQHVLDQVAIVQFNRREDPVVPSTFTHVKCIGVAGVLRDSNFPPRAGGFNGSPRYACCWQVVLVSPLTGGNIRRFGPSFRHWRWRCRRTRRWGPWYGLQDKCPRNRLATFSDFGS